MTDIAALAFEYLMQMDFWNFFVLMGNYYFPYGSLFWMIGMTIYLLGAYKTQSLIYGFIPAAIYFDSMALIDGLIINAYSRMAMQYVGLFATIIAGYVLYQAIKGK